jgi:hypothetical protein
MHAEDALGIARLLANRVIMLAEKAADRAKRPTRRPDVFAL